MNKKSDISAALLGIIVALILWITILGRETQFVGEYHYLPFHTFATILKDFQRAGIRSNFIGNIALFLPFGLLLPSVTGWKWKTVAAGFAFSLMIEAIQLITARGFFDPDDVLLNVFGCIVGYRLHRTVCKIFAKNDVNIFDT